MKRVLNVGGNSKAIALPTQYSQFEHLLLDIDPNCSPDILCDARRLNDLEPGQFDAVYCSHNLEHYYRHDVRKVLAGFQHVLKPTGFAHIRVPDIKEVMRLTIERNLDVDDILYISTAGPVMVIDVIYGFSAEIERSGQDFFAHKTGFTERSLSKVLHESGFEKQYSVSSNLEIEVVAFKTEPDQELRTLFGIVDNE